MEKWGWCSLTFWGLGLLRPLPTVWSMNPRHSRFHHWREEKLPSYIKDNPWKEKSKQWSRKGSRLTSLLIQVRKEEIKGFESWASCWLRSFWKEIQWNKLALYQAHLWRCKINVCMNGQMSEYTWIMKMHWAVADSYDYLIKRASLVKEVAKIPWRSLKK